MDIQLPKITCEKCTLQITADSGKPIRHALVGPTLTFINRLMGLALNG